MNLNVPNDSGSKTAKPGAFRRTRTLRHKHRRRKNDEFSSRTRTGVGVTIREFRCSNCGGPLGHYPVGAEAEDKFECAKCIRQGNTLTKEQKRDQKKAEQIEDLEERWHQEDLQEEAEPETPKESLPQVIAEPQLAGSPLGRVFTRVPPRISSKNRARYEKEIQAAVKRRERGEYDPVEDGEEGEGVHFQDFQFDGGLRSAVAAEGTNHIADQGSIIREQTDDPSRAVSLSVVAQSLPEKSYSVDSAPDWRSGTPWWVKLSDGIERMFVEGERLGKARDPEEEKLITLILLAYYRDGFEDRKISEEFGYLLSCDGRGRPFRHDVLKGEQRVKKMRQRFVERGNILLGKSRRINEEQKVRALLIKYTSEAGEDHYGEVSRCDRGLSAVQFLGQFKIENRAPDAEIVADERFATSEAAFQWFKKRGMSEIPQGKKPRPGKIITPVI
jgi:hypothetical protein